MSEFVGHYVAKQNRGILFIAALFSYALVENIAVAADSLRRHIRNAESGLGEAGVRGDDPLLKIGRETGFPANFRVRRILGCNRAIDPLHIYSGLLKNPRSDVFGVRQQT